MKKGNIFWGLFFIAAAAIMLVGRFGYFENINIWSLFVTVLMIAWLIHGISHREIWSILLPVAILINIYDEQLGLTAITPGPVLGAAILGSLGISIMFPNLERKHHYHNDGCNHQYKAQDHRAHFEQNETTEEMSGEELACSVTFGSSIKYINSNNLKRVNIDCSFGAMKVYLDNAMIQSGNAVIDVNVSFGGLELYVPKTWIVDNQVRFSLGGMEEKNRSEGTGVPTLKLTGRASFAGITVLYV